MKGKNIFTKAEINALRNLINQRIFAGRVKQKSLRAKMRKIGFYGQDDYGIFDLKPYHLDRLINSGRIIVSDGMEEITEITSNNKEIDISHDRKLSLKHFKQFNPQTDNIMDLPVSPGNYLICLNEGSKLPDVGIPFKTTKHAGLEVIYTGISKDSLRKRDYKQHFTGNNAGRSTIRKSIGSMFGFGKIPRDKDPNTGKTMFRPEDEEKLSSWMLNNLTLFYFTNPSPDNYEDVLIDKLNPPLNLSKNKNIVNKEFRKKLSELRNKS